MGCGVIGQFIIIAIKISLSNSVAFIVFWHISYNVV
jgi:hypothetical protein